MKKQTIAIDTKSANEKRGKHSYRKKTAKI